MAGAKSNGSDLSSGGNALTHINAAAQHWPNLSA